MIAANNDGEASVSQLDSNRLITNIFFQVGIEDSYLNTQLIRAKW